MISGLLDLARVDGGPVPDHVVDAGAAAQTAVDLYQDQIDQLGARVRVGPLPSVMADEAQLAEVFSNLIGNSLKFTNGNAPKVDVSATGDGEWCWFRVADNGIGIRPDRADEVFEMFVREGRSDADGHGIGLALVRRIVERQGGRIWVEPGSEVGADIRFVLPAGPLR